MTVKELKELLSQFDDNLLVMIPNRCWNPMKGNFLDVVASNVTRGVNEFDGCIFIDDYEEDEESNI